MKGIVLVGALVLVAEPAFAQQDSVLVAAVQLASEGQSDSARAIVRRRMVSTLPSDSLFPEVLYTAGVVAGNIDSAMMFLRRVSIEFSRSAWADQALLRMAQLAFATGDIPGTLRASERILEDYPSSPVVASAAFWAGRAYFEQGDLDRGCRRLSAASAGAGEDFELSNRIRYYIQRCESIPGQREPTTTDSIEPGTRVYSVQVAAVGNAAAADDLMRELSVAGYTSHVVREDGLFKVRVGRFGAREQAQTLSRELRDKLDVQAFVVEER